MAYDPEARETSNAAMIVGIIVLVLLVGGALAYFATRQPNVVETAAPVIVDQNPAPATNTVVVEKQVPVPVDSGPDTVVVQPPPVERTTRSTTTIEHNRVIPAPDTAEPAPRSEGDTNVTINNAPRASSNGAPAGNAATGADAAANNNANNAVPAEDTTGGY